MKNYSVSDTVMYKGGWVAPPSEKIGGINYVTDERLKEVAESGINLLHVGYYPSDAESTRKMIEYASKNGVYLIIGFNGPVKDDFSIDEIKDNLAEFAKNDYVIGFNLCDEPGQRSFKNLARSAELIRPYINGKMIYVNLMPMYATQSQLQGGWWSPHESEATTAGYYDVVDDFYATVDTEVMSYDFYPFRHEKGVSDPRYFDQLCVMNRLSKKYDKPVWNFTQVTSWNRDAVRNMTYSEMAWLNNTSLACGVTCLQYFCYWTPCDNVETFLNAMISKDGYKTRHYYFAQDLNRKVDAIAPYLLKATHEGVIAFGDTLAPYPTEYALRTYGNIETVMSDGMIIGCFKLDGKNMYYLVNTSVTETRVLEVSFKKDVDCSIVVGTETFDFQGKDVKRAIAPGEGMLIIEK